jgi:ferredoxin
MRAGYDEGESYRRSGVLPSWREGQVRVMNIDSATLVYFSPTRTTRRVLEGIARGTQAAGVEHWDLTLPDAETRESMVLHGGLALFGAPVYGGRIPPLAAQRLRQVKGDRAPAIAVVVYGNRAYEDALLELVDLVRESGFTPVAGAAFVGEHSFSTEAMPTAHGRPDVHDQRQAEAFGRAIRDKLAGLYAPDVLPPLRVPGDSPYREWQQTTGISPTTRKTLCTLCGECATVCPTAAIAVWDAVQTDADACIWCCACVKTCPTGARVMEHPRILRSMRWLTENCAERREPETYWGDILAK